MCFVNHTGWTVFTSKEWSSMSTSGSVSRGGSCSLREKPIQWLVDRFMIYEISGLFVNQHQIDVVKPIHVQYPLYVLSFSKLQQHCAIIPPPPPPPHVQFCDLKHEPPKILCVWEVYRVPTVHFKDKSAVHLVAIYLCLPKHVVTLSSPDPTTRSPCRGM